MKLQNWNILADVQMLPDKEFNETYERRFEQMRWSDGVVSPWVPNSRVYENSNPDKLHFRCQLTMKDFSVRTRTLFHKSKLTWKQWAIIIREFILGNSNTYELARLLQITQKTAWGAVYKLKLMCQGRSLTTSDLNKNVLMVFNWGFGFNSENLVVPPEPVGVVVKEEPEPFEEEPKERSKNAPWSGKEPIIYILEECLKFRLPLPQEFIKMYHDLIRYQKGE